MAGKWILYVHDWIMKDEIGKGLFIHGLFYDNDTV